MKYKVTKQKDGTFTFEKTVQIVDNKGKKGLNTQSFNELNEKEVQELISGEVNMLHTLIDEYETSLKESKEALEYLQGELK